MQSAPIRFSIGLGYTTRSKRLRITALCAQVPTVVPTVVSRKYMRVILLDNSQAPTVTGEQVLKKILEKLQ